MVVVPDLVIERERDQRRRPAPARRQPATRNAWKIAPGISAWWRTSISRLDDRPEDRGVGQPVHLADRGVGRAVDVGDDPDDRDAVVERLADAGHGVGQARARARRRRRRPSPVARAEASAMTLAEASLRDQQVGDAAGLERVPELVVLGARDAEDAADALAGQRRRRRPGRRSSCPGRPRAGRTGRARRGRPGPRRPAPARRPPRPLPRLRRHSGPHAG